MAARDHNDEDPPPNHAAWPLPRRRRCWLPRHQPGQAPARQRGAHPGVGHRAVRRIPSVTGSMWCWVTSAMSMRSPACATPTTGPMAPTSTGAIGRSTGPACAPPEARRRLAAFRQAASPVQVTKRRSSTACSRRMVPPLPSRWQSLLAGRAGWSGFRQRGPGFGGTCAVASTQCQRNHESHLSPRPLFDIRQFRQHVLHVAGFPCVALKPAPASALGRSEH